MLGHLLTWNDFITSLLRLSPTSNLLLASILEIYKVFEHIDMFFCRHIVAALYSYNLPNWLRFGGSVSHVESKMMSLRHCWGWQPPQTDSPIFLRHIKSVWAHWYAVHRHTAAALYSYTHPIWVRFWGSGSHVESKWCHYIMVEADSYIKLHPASIWDINTVVEHIDMLFIGIY